MSETAFAQITQLLATTEPPELGPGPRDGVLSERDVNSQLTKALQDSRLSAQQTELVRALLLLWHDHLDASHNISQGIENADGSFVHAIMHRREPDAWNSKYWWRRVGNHPAFSEIARRVNGFLSRSRRREEADLAKRLLPDDNWDAAAFVDACDSARDESLIQCLREIQRIETVVLLKHFFVEGSR